MKRLMAISVPDRLFSRLVIGAVALGFATLLAVGGFGVSVMRANIAYTDLVAHTYRVQAALAEFGVLNERTEAARRGYLLSSDENYYRIYRDTVISLRPTLEKVRDLTRDNPTQRVRVAQLEALTDRQGVAAGWSIRQARSDPEAARAAFARDEAVTLTRNIRALITVMANEEEQLLVNRDQARLQSIQNLVVVAVVGAILLILVGISSLWVILRYTRDLAASRDQLRRLNAGLEDTVSARTVDLQRANDEIQRFAYIVSHDLRSPLVNVMGFTAELEAAIQPLSDLIRKAEAEAPGIVSAEARAAVAEDLPEAVGFIRTSTQKMDRLINAILRLSREGRRVLAPEPVDMPALLRGVADNLKHRTDEVGAVIEVRPDTPDLVSDRLALEQIFANLVENALKYLKPGRPGRIVLGGHEEGGRLIYEVVDNGRGVDPRDHERIFDLFRRAGAQDQPGEGIGLAHVRALTYRLGGTIQCRSGLDQGATFRISLPPRLTAEGAA